MLEVESMQLGLLIVARATAFMVLAPFFSIKGPPVLVKVGLGILLAFLIYPGVSIVEDIPLDLLSYAILVIKEVVVGLTLGLVSMLTFTAIRVAGEMIDIQMGFAMASIFDPQNESRITLVGQFLYFLGILLFLAIDGHHSLILALHKSYELIPLTGAIFHPPLVMVIVNLFVEMFSLGVRIAAPFIAVLVICDISLGLIARTVPQLNVFILGFPLKAGIGLLSLVFALPILAAIIGYILTQMERDLMLIMEHLI